MKARPNPFSQFSESVGVSVLRLHPGRFCVECGTIGYDDEDYCSFCGHELSRFDEEGDRESSRSCASCEAELRHPFACFCGACGAKITG